MRPLPLPSLSLDSPSGTDALYLLRCRAKDSLRGTIAPDLLDSVSGGVRDLDLNGSSSTGLCPPPPLLAR